MEVPASKSRVRATRIKTPARSRVEFGDFQTPDALAQEVCKLLNNRGPRSLLEPTCGTGTFLAAAARCFPGVSRALGYEINAAYVEQASANESLARAEILQADFFHTDWSKVIASLPEPILVIGNPPWVTNAGLGRIDGNNLPAKSNFQNHHGLDARTGKSNFDISEFMLLHLLELLKGRQATLAMLCKTAVARRVLSHAWKSEWNISRAEMRRIDADRHFGAAVDACLLICDLRGNSPRKNVCSRECDLFESVAARRKSGTICWRGGRLVADVGVYERAKHLLAEADPAPWRSGIKHDCAAVMELRYEGEQYRNGLGELIDLEPTFVYPMLKSSDLAAGRTTTDRYMLVPQRSVTDDTRSLEATAPKTWRYLEAHAELLNRRASSVYRHRPPFAIFGVGKYTFSPWKVAVSGLYKEPRCVAVGKRRGKPVVFDDTVYFLPCRGESEARRLAVLLNSESAREFFSAFLFRDSKRPVTAELLRRLDLSKLAAAKT